MTDDPMINESPPDQTASPQNQEEMVLGFQVEGAQMKTLLDYIAHHDDHDVARKSLVQGLDSIRTALIIAGCSIPAKITIE